MQICAQEQLAQLNVHYLVVNYAMLILYSSLLLVIDN